MLKCHALQDKEERAALHQVSQREQNLLLPEVRAIPSYLLGITVKWKEIWSKKKPDLAKIEWHLYPDLLRAVPCRSAPETNLEHVPWQREYD
jgi:hypothetical protein